MSFINTVTFRLQAILYEFISARTYILIVHVSKNPYIIRFVQQIPTNECDVSLAFNQITPTSPNGNATGTYSLRICQC